MNKDTENPQYQLSELRVTYDKRPTVLKLNSPSSAAHYFRNIWDADMLPLQEAIYAIYLNTAMEVIGWRRISTGTSKKCEIDMKLLCSLALTSMATNVMIAHNHPSGQLKASKQDKGLTWQVERILSMFDIDVIDHIILTVDSYFSFVEEDLMKNNFEAIVN